MRDGAHGFDESLGNQQSIERILVMAGQFLDGRRMLRFDGEHTVSGLAKIAQGILPGHRHVASIQAVLNGYFPDADCAAPYRAAGRQNQFTRLAFTDY